MSGTSHIDDFLDYVQRRGIPPRFLKLYRNEVQRILGRFRAGAVDELTTDEITQFLQAEEKRVRNLRAVCVALAQFLQYWEQMAPDELDDPVSDEFVPPSAASPALLQPSRSQHREYVRVPFRATVALDGGMSSCSCSDLSMGGMYLETMQTQTVGSYLTVSFKLRATDAEQVQLEAKVVYADPGVGMGLDFVEPLPEIRALIRNYIESVLARR